jgi:CPA2 family monovalent cation:H+ antiporter-2
MSGIDQLTHLALAALIAVICGAVMTRLRQPAVVGYIVAGVVLGPSGMSLVTDRAAVSHFAQFGVLLLMFVVGMELSLRGFRGVWRPAVIATLLQIAGSVGATLLLARLFGWSTELAVLLGFVVALSSTAVVIKTLEGMNILRTPVAQITVGVLIAQDLAFIPMLLAVRALGGGDFDAVALSKIVFAVAFLGLLIAYLSRRKKIRLPLARLVAGHPDLTPLLGLALCFGAAALTGLAGLSPAYGAFLSGLVIGNSTERPAMLRSIQPIQSILLMVFFLSIGFLIDLGFIAANMGLVFLVLGVVVIAKTVLNTGVLRLAGQPWAHAVITGILLAQIGEFSFVLGQTGLEQGLVAPQEGNLIIAVTALSLVITPLWLFTARRLLRIGIVGVTSGRETVRLFFGRVTPLLLRAGHAWDGYERPEAGAAGEQPLAEPPAASAPVSEPASISPPASSPCPAPEPGVKAENPNA